MKHEMISITETQAKQLQSLGIEPEVTWAVPKKLADTIGAILHDGNTRTRRSPSTPRVRATHVSFTKKAPRMIASASGNTFISKAMIALKDLSGVCSNGHIVKRDEITSIFAAHDLPQPWLFSELIRQGFFKKESQS